MPSICKIIPLIVEQTMTGRRPTLVVFVSLEKESLSFQNMGVMCRKIQHLDFKKGKEVLRRTTAREHNTEVFPKSWVQNRSEHLKVRKILFWCDEDPRVTQWKHLWSWGPGWAILSWALRPLGYCCLHSAIFAQELIFKKNKSSHFFQDLLSVLSLHKNPKR